MRPQEICPGEMSVYRAVIAPALRSHAQSTYGVSRLGLTHHIVQKKNNSCNVQGVNVHSISGCCTAVAELDHQIVN